MLNAIDANRYPGLSRLINVQLQVWPDHERFLSSRFPGGGYEFAEEIAQLILRVAEPLDAVAEDYHWMCDRLYEEELHFRRTGSYRLSRFEDAVREVYANSDFMRRYMNGVLLSHVWWDNHARVIEYYVKGFLAGNVEGYSHLEVGPGHGLLLYLAARDPRCQSATGWDVSETSVTATRRTLERLGTERRVDLVQRNMLDAPTDGTRFDSIVISEVCEHLEDPKEALTRLGAHLSPKGRLFVNVPINSPAPDHIYLLNSPEEGTELVRAAGLEVEEVRVFPMTGFTEERARRTKSTISCAIVARPRG
jgi:2-polyprenyl-3-methyl-5-hydroxy-6-metoxy-1,4-benzoquinol methylase